MPANKYRPIKIGTEICNILLILLLLQAATHQSLAAEAEKVPNLKALVVYAARPLYPYEARDRRQTGTGVVALVVDPSTGVVKNAEMATSTGHEILDNAALSAFRLWRFRPGLVTMIKIPIGFTTGGFVIVGNELKVTKNLDMDTVLAPYLGKGTEAESQYLV